MKLLTSNKIIGLDDQQIQEEILNIKKILLDFRMKQATRQPVKSHLFKLYKRQLAKILTIEHRKNINKSRI